MLEDPSERKDSMVIDTWNNFNDEWNGLKVICQICGCILDHEDDDLYTCYDIHCQLAWEDQEKRRMQRIMAEREKEENDSNLR